MLAGGQVLKNARSGALLGIVLGGRVLVLVMAGLLPTSFMTIHRSMGQVGSTGVTPVLPLAPGTIWVP